MGGDAFENHYRALFDSRWPALRDALLGANTQVARLNRFVDDARDRLPPGAEAIAVEGCFHAPELMPPVGTPLPYYVMDAASVVAARALEVKPGDDVLDLCAAPGGKSLVLLESLADAGSLTANDPSRARRVRLGHVFEGYVPSEIRERVRITGHDGTRWGLHEPERYDRVLVDAPCSSEAHVLADAKALSQWTAARPKQLAIRQGALLAAAVDSTRPGGRIVYCTCALDPRENDGVVAKILKKRSDRVGTKAARCSIGEATEHGWHILPDATGFGPIYFAVLEKSTRA
ncbi:MAG: RsmB/NOP family class I SAM-dependent RNA methyltransferase [Myxococcota bacterium]